MIKVIIVSPQQEHFSEFTSVCVKTPEVDVKQAESGASVLKMASDAPVDLVVTDEVLNDMTGLELAARLVKLNPMINCACVSPLAPDAFHEASEGLGLMPQLPPMPGKEEAETLLSTIKQLKGDV